MIRLLMCFLICVRVAMCSSAALADDTLPLKLTSRNIHDVALHVNDDGAVELQTTGTDPYLFTEPVSRGFDPRLHRMLSFQYFSATGVNQFQVFVLPPLSEANSIMAAGLSISEGWTQYSIDLKPILDRNGGKAESLRLDFGTQHGKTIQIRGLCLRSMSEAEKRLEARGAVQLAQQKRTEARLRSYLAQGYSCKVTSVSVTSTHVRVEGSAPRSDNWRLAETPLYGDIVDGRDVLPAASIHPNASGHFAVQLDRFRRDGDRVWDRLLSGWAIVNAAHRGPQLFSHLRYADTIQSRANLPEAKLRNKKGLGGFGTDRPQSDIEDLGISAVTVNIVLNSFMQAHPGPGRTPSTYCGRTWYTEDRAVAQMDRTMIAAARHNLVVSAIVLLGQPGNATDGEFVRTVAYPDADPSGIFVMPAVTGEAGLSAYAAALDFLAQRYSRPDGQYGRIHHWIMHNEINAGWVWTNAGEKSVLRYMDLYQRSMRTAYLIARQYDPHARVFISLEHHWNEKSAARLYAGEEMLEILADYSRAEGDFDWSVAFHPYPQSLFEPRVWLDTEPTFSFSTPKITFKNLEVLDAWMKRPKMRYLGTRLRKVHLSEQGLNSKGYSEMALREQAAGMAYAWNKLKVLESIEMFHYHNWVDNRGEGGLQIGLRKFPDDRDDPLGKKPIWTVYQSLGTKMEDEANAFALPILDIKSWSEVHYTGAIR